MKTGLSLVARAAVACAVLAAVLPGLAFGAADYATRAVDASRITHRHLLGGVNSRNTVVHEITYEDPANPDGPLRTAGYEPVDRLWVGGVSAGAEESGGDGYEYTAHGVNAGYDWMRGDLSVGVSLAYTAGKIRNNDTDTRNNVETVLLGFFASRDPDCGLYYDVNAGFGKSWNHTLSMDGGVPGGTGSREGRFSASSFALGGNVGYGFDMALAKVTPMIGLQWTRYNQQGYMESATGPVTPNWFSKAENTVLEIPLSVRAGTSWQWENGLILSPEVRAAYIFGSGDRQSSVKTGVAGGGGTTDLAGVESGKNRMRLGLGLKANFNASVDAFFDYNVEFRRGYRSSNVNTGVGMSF